MIVVTDTSVVLNLAWLREDRLLAELFGTAGRAAAIALGLVPSGLLGLLIEAKKRSLLSAVIPLLDRLRADARFRVADDLRTRIAALAGEAP